MKDILQAITIVLCTLLVTGMIVYCYTLSYQEKIEVTKIEQAEHQRSEEASRVQMVADQKRQEAFERERWEYDNKVKELPKK